MRADLAALKRAVKKRPSDATSGGSSAKKARPSVPQTVQSAPSPPASVPAPSPIRVTDEGEGWSDDDVTVTACAAAAASAPAPAPPSSGQDKGKAPYSEGSEPVREPVRLAVEGDGGEFVDVGVSWADNGFEDPDVARKVIEAIRLSQDWERTKARPFDSVTKQFYCTMYRMLHEGSVMERAASRATSLLLKAKKEAAKAKAEAEEATRKVAAAEGKLKEREREFQAEASLLRVQLDSAMTALEEFKADAARYVEKAAKETKKLKKKNRSLGQARDEAVRAKEDALRRGKDDVLLAELRAVADYKSSRDFKNEMTEAGVESFQAGIDVTLDRVRRKFPDLDLAAIETDDEEEEPGESAAEGRSTAEAEAEVTIPPLSDPGLGGASSAAQVDPSILQSSARPDPADERVISSAASDVGDAPKTVKGPTDGDPPT